MFAVGLHLANKTGIPGLVDRRILKYIERTAPMLPLSGDVS